MKYIFVTLVTVLGLYLAETSENPKLLFANRKDIRVIDIYKGKLTKNILVKDVSDAASVDYYYRRQEVCWTDIANEFIKCVSLNGTSEKSKDLQEIKVISRGIASPDGMAIDWLTEKLYWADSETDKIEVAELYGPLRKLLYWKDLDQPRAIALVPSEGIMFWSDWGESPKIERAGMNGDPSTRKVIVDKNIQWPNGLTIDYESRRVFWADGKCFSIYCADFDGLHRVKVVEELKHPFALSYFKQTLYWTDWGTEAIHYCHLNSKTKCENQNQLSLKLSPMYIHVYDQSRQLHTDTPCHWNNGRCSHLCLLAPSPNNYTCSCPTGVKLKDNFTCEDGPNEMLLLARRSDLRRISLDTPDHTPVVIPVTNVHHAIAIDYDPVEQFFYWTDDEAFWIQRARLNGSDQEILIHSEGLDSDGVAIDWLARNLYWSDTENNRIEVARLNGSSRKILLRGGLDKPRAIALYPEGGLMFWTDWGDEPKIERANLDGSDRLTIVDTNLGWPNGVAVDYDEKKIYWVDAKTHVIEMALLDGSNRQVILGDNLPHVFGFSLLGDFLYWTDWQKRSIERLHKHNDTYREVLVDQLPDVMGLKALSVNQKMGFSPCMEDNGGCSHLCFNKPNRNFVCDCPLGYELTSDGKECIIPKAFLLYTQNEDFRRVSLQTSQDSSLPMPGVKQASTIDFDNADRLYWSDISSKTIFRAFMNGSQPEAIVEFGLEFPEGLAVDWIAKNVYWSDTSNNRIEAARLDGSSRKVILWNVSEPKSLAVDPLRGFLYWSEWPDGGKRIVRSYQDGTWAKPIITSDVGRVSGLTVDYDAARLYWLDIDNKRIESSTLEGLNRKVIIKNLYQPNGLALYEDYIFWADWKNQAIEKAHKISGVNRTTIKNSEFVTDLLIFRSTRISSLSPCLEENGNCSHLCIPIPSSASASPSYTCACPTHYTLQVDEKTCLAPISFLIFSQKNSATRLVVEREQECPTIVLPLHNMRNVHSISYDPVHNFVYWIDNRAQLIRKANHNGLDSQIIVKKDQINPVDIAVDGGSQLIFWSCAITNVINITKTDGTEVGSIVGIGNDKPRSLEVHSQLGMLFFINLASPPVIEKLILSGLTREIIVKDRLRTPSALAVDTIDNRIYWVDFNPTVIESADIYGGNSRTIIVNSHLNHPDNLAVHGNYLYWVDSELNIIERVNKMNGQERSKVLTRLSQLTDILSVNPNSLKSAQNHPCLTGGSKCSHFCVVSPPLRSKQMNTFLMPLENLISYREDLGPEFKTPVSLSHCECPQGMVLSQDDVTCVPKPLCPPKQFTCRTAQTCIPMQWRCDGLQECPDGSDELNCSPSMCDPSFFRCADGQCIDNKLVCDRTAHCSDESDEMDCCPPGQAMCKATGHCVSCSTPDQCPENMGQCPFTIPHVIGDTEDNSVALYIVAISASTIILMCIAGVVLYYRRRPSLLDDHEMETQHSLKEGQSRNYRVVLSGGKVYTGVRGEPTPNCGVNAHQHMRVAFGPNGQALPDLCPDVVNIGGGRGVFVDRTQITGASSSSSSMTHYPRETMNPPPTPVAEPRAHCQEPHCCYPTHSAPPTSLNSYRHYKTHNRPPPPTPCSTDVCDDSDFYSSVVMSPHNSNCFSPASTCYSSPPPTDYDSDPYPPPPTPQTQYACDLTSCPPSPSTDRSYFIHGPCPSPLSPSLSE